jgi:hypothetical protein
MDSATSEVISKLKFIGKIQKGEKINVKYLYVQPTNWFTRLSRTFYLTDNRMNAFNFIESTINRSFEIITVNKQDKTNTIEKLNDTITYDLREAIVGINNFKDTYKDDVMFCCKLDTLIENILYRIGNYNEVE